MTVEYEVRDVDQSAEIIALKAERDQYRKEVIAKVGTLTALYTERDQLRAALERIAHGETDGWGGAEIARRALEGK